MSERIDFAEAIEERQLLRLHWEILSLPQQVALKLLYGIPLSTSRADPSTGLTERAYWDVFQGAAEVDDLGYVTRILEGAPPYEARSYQEGVLIVGRRSGKTALFAATIMAYESTCGGHESYLGRSQQGICFQIAQDLRMARNALHFIRGALESSPLLAREIHTITADRIDLKNRFSICCVPATLKSVRGFASPVSVLDEVGVWYQEAESANPDYEIYRALSPAQLQFPDRKVVLISSPWNKAGLLYQYFEAGTGGYKLRSAAERDQYANALVINVPTAVFNNPVVTREFLTKERARDERAFERELLARFQDSISGFIPGALVEAAIDSAIYERPYDPKWVYFPAIDPAFKRDAFAFTICHNENGAIVQDVVRRFLALKGVPLNPNQVLDEIVPLIKAYRCDVVYTDQYQVESFSQLLRVRGFEAIPITFTAKSKAQLFGNLQQLFLQRKIRLLDDRETIREIKALERTLTEGGQVIIAAPRGLHDDMAAVMAIAASQAMWTPLAKEATPLENSPSVQARIEEQIRRKWAGLESVSAWD